MWEDMDSRKKSKGQKLFSQGVVVLVCLILAAQAVFFGKYLIDSRRSDSSDGSSGRTMQETERQTAQADGQGNAQDNAAGGRAGRHSCSDAGFKAGDNGTAPDRPNEPRQDGHPDRTSSAASAPRPGSTSRANPPDPAHPHSPASTAADSRAPYPIGTPTSGIIPYRPTAPPQHTPTTDGTGTASSSIPPTAPPWTPSPA